MITCQELAEGLYEYLSDEQWPPKRAEFDLHLNRCAACTAYLKSYKQTVELARDAYDPAVYQPEMPEALVQAILAKAPRKSASRDQRGVG